MTRKLGNMDPMIEAVCSDDAGEVQALLDKGFDVHMGDVEDDALARTALHYAAYFGNAAMCQRLLSADADIEAQDGAGATALAIAINIFNQGTLECLLQQGANLFAPGGCAKQLTPLHWARGPLTWEALLKWGADPNYLIADPKPTYLTPFQEAVANDRGELIEAMRAHAAIDLSQTTIDGRRLAELAPDGSLVKAWLLAEETGKLVQEAIAQDGGEAVPACRQKPSGLAL